MSTPFRIGSQHEAATLARQGKKTSFAPLVDGLIDEGSVGMIVGGPKAKKSFLAANLALALGQGVDFLGRKTFRPKRVCYVSLELPQKSNAIRLAAMQSNTRNVAFVRGGEVFGDDVLVNCKTQTVREGAFESLIETLLYWKADVLIIDPFYYIAGEENDNVTVTALLKQFAYVRDILGCAVIVVHHGGKGKIDWSEPFLAARGASAIGGFYEWVLGIEHVGVTSKSVAATIHHGSRNLKAVEPFSAYFDERSLTWVAEPVLAPEDALQEALGGDDYLPINDLRKRLKGSLRGAELNEAILAARGLERILPAPGRRAGVQRVLK